MGHHARKHDALRSVRVEQAVSLEGGRFSPDIGCNQDAVDVAFRQLAARLRRIAGHIQRKAFGLCRDKGMRHAVERVIRAEAEHIGERRSVVFLHGGFAQRLKQRGGRFGTHALRQAVRLAGEGRVVLAERLRPLRAPAVACGIGGGDVRDGIPCDALHGLGENMMGDVRRHWTSFLVAEIGLRLV